MSKLKPTKFKRELRIILAQAKLSLETDEPSIRQMDLFKKIYPLYKNYHADHTERVVESYSIQLPTEEFVDTIGGN